MEINKSSITDVVKASGGYLQRAIELIKPLSIEKVQGTDTELAAMLQEVVAVDQPKVLAIAEVLSYISTFTRLVMDNVGEMKYGARYKEINAQFAHVRKMFDEFGEHREDDYLSLREKIEEAFMQIGGTPKQRFEKVFGNFTAVSKDLKNQVDHEETIRRAYETFRLALQDGETWTYEVMAKQKEIMDAAMKDVDTKAQDYDVAARNVKKDDPAEMAKIIPLRQARDAAKLKAEEEQARYRLFGKLQDNFKQAYAAGELHQQKLGQTTQAKKDLWQTGVVFFSTNKFVYAFMAANYTAQLGTKEGVEAQKAMYDEMDKSLEQMAGQTKVDEEAVRVAHQAAIKPESYAKAAEALLQYEKSVQRLIDELDKKRAEASDVVRKKADETFNAILETRIAYLREKAA